MFKLLGALLVGILSASLAVIYQNDIASVLGRAPVTVRVVAGGWYPHSQPLGGKSDFSETDKDHIASFSHQKESNFARITISNNTARDIPNSVIKVGDEQTDLWKYDAVIIRKENGKQLSATVDRVSDNINVGPLPAAQDTLVYLWSDRGFSYPYDLSDIEVLVPEGKVSKRIVNLEASSDELFLGQSSETIAWFFVFFLLIICGGILYTLHHGSKFVTALFKDDDYYLAERMHFELDPKKYTVPEKLPQ